MNRAGVRAAEHLKSWVSEVIDKYHASDVNPAQVKLVIWDEIQVTLSSLKPKHFEDVLWLRVSIKNGESELIRNLFEILTKTEMISSRYIGPREEGDDGVFYIAVLTTNIHKAVELVDNLTSEGYSVRDWSFGANRR